MGFFGPTPTQFNYTNETGGILSDVATVDSGKDVIDPGVVLIDF